MELDDVIDQVIAERVINRHRGKWIAAFALLVALVLVILFLGGWKEPEGRQVPTLRAPVSVTAGRFEFGFESATLTKKPKGTYSSAESYVTVTLFIMNIDDETRTSDSMQGSLLRLVPAKGDLIESNGATCDADLNYTLVYGLEARKCTAKFDVPQEFTDTEIEIGVLGESYESDEGFAVVDRPYWHHEEPVAVVQLTAKKVTEE